MKHPILFCAFVSLLAMIGSGCHRRTEAPPLLGTLTFSQSTGDVACYDFVEVTVSNTAPSATNPFTDIIVSGSFAKAGSAGETPVEGFCDSEDGRLYRVRFMPSQPGHYEYYVNCFQGNSMTNYTGAFEAADKGRRGLLRVDPEHQWHFLWEGTGEHYFWNGTTAFLLMGWDDEKVIRDSIDRLHGYGINRIRVLLDGRTDHYWTEPVKPGNGFQAHLNPWPAQRPDDIKSPQFDYTRFNCAYWQKYERMLMFAREKDVVISVIFDWNDTPVHPAAGSADERRYFQYAVARLGAFANVTWDLGDDLDSFRDDAWTHSMGTALQQWDAYHHLATSHPVDNRHQDRVSAWFNMTSFQWWDRPQYEWMLWQRRSQAATGRIIPQVNEEYGYEDHYPQWAPYQAPAASADANRRAAWEITMAGCYQTTGETARRGTGVPPDSGGGWINGRGDETMLMLQGYDRMVKFFTAFEWWKTDPHSEFVNHGYCLAEPGEIYVVYLPKGGDTTVKLEPGRYTAQWFNPRNGEYQTLPDVEDNTWQSPSAPGPEDWVLLLRRIKASSRNWSSPIKARFITTTTPTKSHTPKPCAAVVPKIKMACRRGVDKHPTAKPQQQTA